jgi:hypothetical protein
MTMKRRNETLERLWRDGWRSVRWAGSCVVLERQTNRQQRDEEKNRLFGFRYDTAS